MQGKVEICGINTAKLKTLTHTEMDYLLHRAKEGDTAAREKLIEGNLRLVLSVIQRFQAGERIRTICSRWGASVYSRPSPTLTPPKRFGSPPTVSP